jgi:hypothetical protein
LNIDDFVAFIDFSSIGETYWMITVSVEHVRDSQTSKITQRKPEERTIREIHARQTRIAKKNFT